MKNLHRFVYLISSSRMQSAHLLTQAGFTLLEVLCVATMAGVLMAIAAPGWLNFANNRSLNVAQDQAYRVIQQAQNEAASHRTQWQISFQEVGGVVQWATHSVNVVPTGWQTLQTGVRIAPSPDTTFSQSSGIYQMQFDQQGNVNGQLGKFTLVIPNGGSSKRCIIASTVLGTLRKAQNSDCD